MKYSFELKKTIKNVLPTCSSSLPSPPKKQKPLSAYGPHKNWAQVNLAGGPQFVDPGLDQNTLCSALVKILLGERGSFKKSGDRTG